MKWVRLKKISQLTGLSEHSIRGLRKRGEWQEGKIIRKVGSNLWFNVKEIEDWIEGKST